MTSIAKTLVYHVHPDEAHYGTERKIEPDSFELHSEGSLPPMELPPISHESLDRFHGGEAVKFGQVLGDGAV